MLITYMLFALLGSTLPWIPQAREATGEGTPLTLSPSSVAGGEDGPDRVLLIEKPQDALAVRMQMIRSANETLDMAYYAIGADECGQAFLGEVLDAADRGVQVRILIDGKINGTGKTKRLMRALTTHPNIECRKYNPINVFRPWKWHAVLHDKFILADGQRLLLGGRNVSDRFFAPEGYAEEITQDRDVFVVNMDQPEKSVCRQLETYMDRLWTAEDTRPQKPLKGGEAEFQALRDAAVAFARRNPSMYVRKMEDYQRDALPARSVSLITNPIHTGKKQPVVAQGMRALAMQASSSVIIQTPYATVSDPLLETMRAIDENADTTLLTNSLASSPNYIAFSNYYSRRTRLLDAGLDIYELQSKDSIHGKSMIVDDRLSAVGSFNMDDRSFRIDTESMLVIDSVPFAESLHGAMSEYLGSSLQVGPDNRYLADGDTAAEPVHIAKRACIWLISVLSRLFYYLV
ncbi:phospholipase D family protein [Eubacteriales bacterium OttesenSCG-928-A19]|nr:phospholipase D family protein [Eubacteriales bacterium OttesenSCG-928-A19]